ncbi:LysR family transcriptional regulator [Achromobacter marplatensis]|uniref:LysR family transcriptional regulator n=1 Tax=Achromobacter marplatensis TaxID=470868 RepID=A0AA43B182_9BURK|nr:LysR family transcriptional regulator [Achromobacter marplatensis]EJO30230.1 LysR family transcriptional regulator [Achromobacter marplatensis]MDH2054186.1 LysR family transcriptional regulator [Achromobacter marplatensis]
MTPFRGKLRIRHLEIVLTVSELGNLSKAAAQLHSTQSGLSRAIAEIEELVGARLFERTAKGTTCTPLGEAMCRHARLLLTDFRKAEIDLAAMSRGDEGSLTVGCFSMFAGWPVAQAARAFRQAYPRITLTIEIGTHERLIEDLDAGGVDVLISRFSSTVNPQIYRSTTLLEDQVVLACATGHPLAGRTGTTLADYVAYPWITALPGSRIRGELEMSLRKAGLVIPDMIGALSLEFGREILLDSQYLWMLPGSVAAVRQARGELVVLPARPAIGKSPLAAIWRRDRPSTLQARAFTEQVELAIQADNIALAA